MSYANNVGCTYEIKQAMLSNEKYNIMPPNKSSISSILREFPFSGIFSTISPNTASCSGAPYQNSPLPMNIKAYSISTCLTSYT